MNKVIAGLVIVIVLAGGAFLLTRNKNDNTNKPAASSQSSSTNNTSSSSTTATATNSVEISNMAFSPADITVKKGTTVTWTNKDAVGHTVTENDGQDGPKSGTLNQGDTYTFTYSTVGTFKYHCSIHPDMTGSVTVTE